MNKYKLILLDLDGTTVASNGAALPSARVIKAVAAVKEKQKVIVSLATGRPYNFAKNVINALDLDGPIVCNGGAEIVDAKTGEILHQTYLSKEAMKELVRLSLPFGYRVYTDNDQYSEPLSSEADVDKGAAKLFIENVAVKDAVFVLEELAAVTSAAAHPTTSWGEGDVVDIHVTHLDGTKRHGVERLMKLLGFSQNETLAIGDSYNDIPLLEAAGLKVAMGDAPEEVKAIADFIAPTLADDGVAVTLERYILDGNN